MNDIHGIWKKEIWEKNKRLVLMMLDFRVPLSLSFQNNYTVMVMPESNRWQDELYFCALKAKFLT